MKANRFLPFALVACACFADDTPPWLKEAAAIPTPDYAKKASAVVLLDEEALTVEEGGRFTVVSHYAARILTSQGKSAASASKVYITTSGKVRDLRAWLLLPDGTVKRYGKDKVVDIALVNNDVYNEVRSKVISAAGGAVPGAVFGCESIAEERAMFLQAEWAFRSRHPVVASRYTVTLPAGWRVEEAMFSHPKLTAAVNGSNSTWELRDLHDLKTAPRLALTFIPPDAARTGEAQTFTSWPDVSRWLTEIADPQSVPDEAVTEKARALAAGAATELERIQAIARFVQRVTYISIQTGMGRGGGYRPHPASLVFAKSYGDCKDKANLMRAMLKPLGIDSYLVAIYSRNRNYVHKDWPSPQQFNHMILAVKVGADTEAPAVMKHPKLGKLLIFDPTDPDIPCGSVPEYEQRSYALLAAGDAGDLIRTPGGATTADNRLERQVEVSLAANGSIAVAIQELSVGEAAMEERREFHHLSQADYAKTIERWIERGVKGASISKIQPVDNETEFRLGLEFAAPAYAQLMMGRMLVFKPALVPRRASFAEARKYPIVYNDTFRVKLPPAFKVDEMPPPQKLDSSVGKYRASCEAKDGELLFNRTLELNASTASDNPKKRTTFFDSIQTAEQAPVVLVRQ